MQGENCYLCYVTKGGKMPVFLSRVEAGRRKAFPLLSSFPWLNLKKVEDLGYFGAVLLKVLGNIIMVCDV